MEGIFDFFLGTSIVNQDDYGNSIINFINQGGTSTKSPIFYLNIEAQECDTLDNEVEDLFSNIGDITDNMECSSPPSLHHLKFIF